MPTINPYQLELFNFYSWLEANHKEIHNKFRSNFHIPVDNTGIGLSDEAVSDAEFELLVDLLQYYYDSYPGLNKSK